MSDENNNSDAKNTPPSWSSLKDARELPGAGTYPNQEIKKTRSGHCFILDDSKGAEHVTLQHRSGSCIQFMPSGAIQFTSHNGEYTVVFGEKRMTITGAYDVTVNGAASMKVDGDYNMTVKNLNLTADQDLNITARNTNFNLSGNLDVQAKNKTEKFEGSSTTQAQQALSLQAGEGAASLTSVKDSVVVGAAKSIGIKAAGGDFLVSSSGKTSIASGGAAIISSTDGKTSVVGKTLAINSSGKISVKGQQVAIDGAPVDIQKNKSENAGTSTSPDDIKLAKAKVPSQVDTA